MSKKKRKRYAKGSHLKILFNTGKANGLWKNQKDCATQLHIDYEQFIHACRGNGGIVPSKIDAMAETLKNYLREKNVEVLDGKTETGPPENASFKDLFLVGQQIGLWTGQKDCAEALGVSADSVRRFLSVDKNQICSNERSTKFYERTMQKLHETLQQKNSGRKKATVTFRDYYLEGLKQKIWAGYEDCGKQLGIYRKVVSQYVNKPAQELLARPRVKKRYKQALAKIATLVEMPQEAQTLAPQPTSEKKHAPKKVPEQKSEKTTAMDAIMHPPQNGELHDTINHLIAQIGRQIGQEAVQTVQQTGRTYETCPNGIAPSSWIDDLIAGRLEIETQRLPDVRFVLTAPSLMKLLTKYTAAENRDTVALIRQVIIPAVTELRRRVTLYAQFGNSDDRHEFYMVAGKELAELILVIQQSDEADITGTAEMYNSMRSQFDKIRNSKHQRRLNK